MSPVSAQIKMHQVFRQMPDSILPLLTKNNRLDCIDFLDSKMKAIVKNILGDKSSLDSLTDNYLKLQMSSCSTVEMKLLPVKDTVQYICVVSTFTGPAASSSIDFYTTGWKHLKTGGFIDSPDFNFFFIKNDTASAEKLNQIKNRFDPVLYKISLSPDKEKLSYSLSFAGINKKDYSEVMPYLSGPIYYIWNNKKFIPVVH